VTDKYDNRNHPLFEGQNNQNSLNLGLTTFCTMRCPNCSISVPKHKAEKTAKDASVSDIIRDSRWMRGLRRVHLTGGEPLLHPDFRYVAEHARDWFHCSYLTVETNGHLYHKYKDVFRTFDLVFVTHYEQDTIYPGNPGNGHIVDLVQQDLGDRMIREPPVRHEHGHGIREQLVQLNASKGQLPEDVACSKYRNPGLPAGWYDGKVYACCVSFGISSELGIPVTEDWRQRIQNLAKGCIKCCYHGT
jgi:hypothetical protein